MADGFDQFATGGKRPPISQPLAGAAPQQRQRQQALATRGARPAPVDFAQRMGAAPQGSPPSGGVFGMRPPVSRPGPFGVPIKQPTAVGVAPALGGLAGIRPV